MKSNHTLQNILSVLGGSFPLETAVTGDVVGLQTGSRRANIGGILVAHDVTPEVIKEAKKLRANLILSYHPLVYSSITSVEEERKSRVNDTLAMLVRERIALYVVHTTFDTAREGTSEQFALALGLEDPKKLEPLKEMLVKLSVFVPEKFTDVVMERMAIEGAGMIGKYDSCSFRTLGTGTFKPLRGAKPFLGKKNILERLSEEKLEMIVPRWKLPSVIRAMKDAHPYEEVAHDVMGLENSHPELGMGTVGEFPKALSVKDFIARVKRTAGQIIIRASSVDKAKRIKRVALVSGSGGAWMEKSQRAGADAFITGDVKYNSFCDASHNNFLLVDAGHRETERFVVPALTKHLRTILPDVTITESKPEEAIHYY